MYFEMSIPFSFAPYIKAFRSAVVETRYGRY
jgi:hypothetical protein